MPTVTLDSTRIHYLDQDPGDANLTLLLVHDFPLDGQMWDQTVRRFATPHRVIVPDLKALAAPTRRPTLASTPSRPTPTTLPA